MRRSADPEAVIEFAVRHDAHLYLSMSDPETRLTRFSATGR